MAINESYKWAKQQMQMFADQYIEWSLKDGIQKLCEIIKLIKISDNHLSVESPHTLKNVVLFCSTQISMLFYLEYLNIESGCGQKRIWGEYANLRLSHQNVMFISHVPIFFFLTIVHWVFKDQLIVTTVKKGTFKKLILDCCNKAAFSFDNQTYAQKDNVSMG